LNLTRFPGKYTHPQAAIIRFSGFELNGRRIKVEEIQDKPNRVRVPEKLVFYAVGGEKKTKDGTKNNLRKANNARRDKRNDSGDTKWNSSDGINTVTKRTKAQKRRKLRIDEVLPRLNESERCSFERAAKNGFLALEGYYKGRRKSALASIHKEWCDTRDIPQIILCKAYGGRILDNLIVDLSTLRLSYLSEQSSIIEQFLTRWKADVLIAAEHSGMNIKSNIDEDCSICSIDHDSKEELCFEDETNICLDIKSWHTASIPELPAIVFEGERSMAKAMAQELAQLWDTKERIDDTDASHDEKSGKKKKSVDHKIGAQQSHIKGLRHHRNSRSSDKYW